MKSRSLTRRRAVAGRLRFLIFTLVALTASCSPLAFSLEDEALRIELTAGRNWVHPFPLLGPITKPNYPTFALWISDEAGTYLDTVFATSKVASESWIMADDNRPEALPTWSHARGGQPTKAAPAPDAVSGSSPRTDCAFALSRGSLPQRVLLWLEINHSVDYNSTFPENLHDPAAIGYSGGPGGSGQPALLYRAVVDFGDASGSVVPFTLVGHSEPGGAWIGTDAYPDVSGLNSALEILADARSILD
jgi:hypothetical protein